MINCNFSTNSINILKKIPAPKILIPALGFACCLNTTPLKADSFSRRDKSQNIEIVDSITIQKNPTELCQNELLNAPSPMVTIAGKKQNVGIVVDLAENKLYRYDQEGKVKDGYHVASGKLNKQGKSITGTGLRRVHHIENYPYKCAPGTKRSRNPKAYGPNILYLTVINPKTGAEQGSNGEFIHGNNDTSSIGKYASHGCIRMDNDVIKQFAKEVEKGTLVLIK